ncbi:hypothetical protein [Aeromonas phage Aer_P220]|uniref:Uncharacterized protein n=1 Tax=Aeromonas phage Aer_P220 TaxID=2951227 RepID=A0A9E7NKT4_9CAUD|nr:hypothetical protein [Aeromonas phage Aer_P220]
MYQAIQVKYLSCTNFRGSRFKATAAAGSVTVSYDHALSAEKNAEAAMLALVNKFGWDECPATWQGGVLPNGDYVFVRLPEGAKNV